MSDIPRTDAVVGKPRPHILALCCALERELAEAKHDISDVNAEATTLAERASILQAESWGWQQAAETAMAKSGMGTVTACKLASEHRREVERLRGVEAYAVAQTRALELILPLAKGYAAAHPVGSNAAYVAEAEAVLAQSRHEIGIPQSPCGSDGAGCTAANCSYPKCAYGGAQGSHAVGIPQRPLADVLRDVRLRIPTLREKGYDGTAEMMAELVAACERLSQVPKQEPKA